MPNVVFHGEQVLFDGDDVVFYGASLPDTPIVDHGFTLKVNGVDYTLPAFNGEQLRSLHLSDAAFDAQIGSGTIVMPGAPGWVAGDRLAFYADDADGTFLGNWFVTDRGQKRQSVETGAIETSYNLMDPNRHLIGWRLIDELVNPGAGGDTTLFTGTIVAHLAHLTLDSTTWVDADPTVMPERTYVSDGAMDIIADLILYTGKTVFLRATADAEFELHFHSLFVGPVADITISDVPDDIFDANTFSPIGASVTFSSSDLHTVVEVRDSIGDIVAGGDAAHVGPHSAGGLRWDYQGSYSAVNQDDLVQFANSILLTQADERPTYACTIGPLTGAQVASIPPGSHPINVTSEVMGNAAFTGFLMPVRNRSISVWNDSAGNPVPGLWNVSLEFGYPQRQPTATLGYGGQGGYSGLLYDPFNFADHVRVDYGDVWPPVGQQAVVTGHLEGSIGNAVTTKDIRINFFIEQFRDEAETIPCTDFSLLDDHALTGDGGLAQVILSHDTDTGCVKMRVTGEVAV